MDRTDGRPFERIVAVRTDVAEVATNPWGPGGVRSFHIKLRDGRNLNLANISPADQLDHAMVMQAITGAPHVSGSTDGPRLVRTEFIVWCAHEGVGLAALRNDLRFSPFWGGAAR